VLTSPPVTYANALITGASSGIGRALAERLARKGTHVVVAARRQAELDTLVESIERAGGSAEALVLDVADSDAAFATIQALDARLPLDLVVANAGIATPTPAKRIEWKKVAQVFDINVLGATATLCAPIAGMLQRGRGHIVGVASLAGYRGLPGSAAYSSSKAALIAFLDSLRVDLARTPIAVTTICPGYIVTDLTADKPRGTMPFLMPLDEAADIIERAIEARVPLCAFPAPMAALARTALVMPTSMFDWLARRINLTS
jgi:short-subunit dehydrogenase